MSQTTGRQQNAAENGSEYISTFLANVTPDFYPVRHVPRHLANLVMLVVSQDNSCRYCVQDVRLMMLANGFREREVQNILADLYGASLSQTQEAALKFARRLSRANPRPGPNEITALRRRGLSAEAVTELGSIVAATNVANRIGTVSGLQPAHVPDGLDRWYRFPSRLAVRWSHIRNRRKYRDNRPYKRGEYRGPGARLLDAMPPVPALRHVRRTLEYAWGPSSISMRTRAMMAGVVGRLVDCQISGDIARYWLRREGLSNEEADSIVGHLDSSLLTDVDRSLLSAARASVHLQDPAPLVKQIHALRTDESKRLADDALVFLSVANAMCRLAVLERVE